MSMTCEVETIFGIHEFWPKGNNDMMQGITCNKSTLLAPRLKMTKKKKKDKYWWKTNLIDINSFPYEIEV
jgi:hypothetical protein